MSPARRFFANTEGAVAVIFGILLPALLGIAALGIEIGHWYSERNTLQMAADTAAYSALVAYHGGIEKPKAIAIGKARARASGFTGSDAQISITIPSPDTSLGPNSARAVLAVNTQLYLSALFLDAGSIGIGVTAHATVDEVSAAGPCMLALKSNQSRAIVMASSVRLDMKCVVASNSGAADAIWAEGTAALRADCASLPGNIATNGGASVTLTDCPGNAYPRQTTDDYMISTPFWGSSAVPDTGYFVDQSISQGRYGAGMPGGAILQPGKYGKQVEIDGTVTLKPGIYYFTNGFRAAPGSKISGQGVTIYVDQTKVLDIAQGVSWDLTAPTSGPTKGMAIMGKPSVQGGTVRLIGVMGNVEGGIYFPNQTLQTENGPNLATARCTQIVASTIDIRGTGTIANDCSAGGAVAAGGASRVRLAAGAA